MKTVKVKCPAKLNLYLDITHRMPNGYHIMEMVMQAVNLFDTVYLTLNDTGEVLSLIHICFFLQGLGLDAPTLLFPDREQLNGVRALTLQGAGNLITKAFQAHRLSLIHI